MASNKTIVITTVVTLIATLGILTAATPPLMSLGPTAFYGTSNQVTINSANVAWLDSATDTTRDFNTGSAGSAAPTTGLQTFRFCRHVTIGSGAAFGAGSDCWVEGSIGNSGTAEWILSARNLSAFNRGFGVQGGEEHLTGTVFASAGTITSGSSTPSSGTITTPAATTTTATFVFNDMDTTISGGTYVTPTGVRCLAEPKDSATPIMIQQAASVVGGGSASITFDCFTPSTGAAATCPTFTYFCNYNH